jgi:hypothetical protein
MQADSGHDSGSHGSFRGGGRGRGRGGGASSHGPTFLTGTNASATPDTGWGAPPAASSAPSPTWGTSTWGVPDGGNDSSDAGWGQVNEVTNSSWASETNDTSRKSGWGAPNEDDAGSRSRGGWAVPGEEKKGKSSGVASKRRTSGGWGHRTTEENKAEWGSDREEKKGESSSWTWGNTESTASPSGKGRVVRRGSMTGSGDWANSTSFKHEIPDKAKSEWKGRDDRPTAPRALASAMAGPNDSRSSKATRDNAKSDTFAPQGDSQAPAVDWTDVPRSTRAEREPRAASPTGTDLTASATLALPFPLANNKKGHWSNMIAYVYPVHNFRLFC